MTTTHAAGELIASLAATTLTPGPYGEGMTVAGPLADALHAVVRDTTSSWVDYVAITYYDAVPGTTSGPEWTYQTQWMGESLLRTNRIPASVAAARDALNASIAGGISNGAILFVDVHNGYDTVTLTLDN